MKNYLLITVFALINLSSYTYGQNDSTEVKPIKVIVIKNDGAQYIGYLLEDNSREILLDTDQIGKVYMPKYLIKSIKPYDANTIVIVEDSLKKDSTLIEESATEIIPEIYENLADSLYNNFISTKYIQTDNAFPLRKGEAFLKITLIGLEVQLPLSKNLSIGGITSWAGAPVALKMKYSIPLRDSAYFAYKLTYGNMLFGSPWSQDIRSGGGSVSGVLTFGERENNFSFGLGYAMAHVYSIWFDWNPDTGVITEVPLGTKYYHFAYLTFSLMQKLTDKLSFIFDSFGAYGTEGVFVVAAPALRFGPKPRHKFQVGGAIGIYDGLFVPIPIPTLSYTYVFEKRKF